MEKVIKHINKKYLSIHYICRVVILLAAFLTVWMSGVYPFYDEDYG